MAVTFVTFTKASRKWSNIAFPKSVMKDIEPIR